MKGTAADTMPPLYYLILHLWQQLGTSVAFQRLPGIVFSLGIILVSYSLVNRLAGRQAAIWTAAILAVSPLQFYHAQDIRMYSLATLFILGWDWFAIQMDRVEDPIKMPVWKWLLMVICGAGALYSHALAGFGLLAPFGYYLCKKDRKRLISCFAAGVFSLVLYFPWLVMVPGQIAKVQHAFWTPVPGIVEVIQAVIMVLGDIPSPAWVLGFVLFAILMITILCGMEFFRHKQDNAPLLFFTLMTLIPPICLFLLSYLMRPMFVPRGFLSGYVGISACIGVLGSRSRKIEQILIGGLILVSSLVTLPVSINYESFPRSPFQPASQYLLSEMKNDDIVLHDNKLSFFPFQVYAPGLNQRFLADQPGSANDTLARQTSDALHLTSFIYIDPDDAVQGFSRIFFVVFSQTIQEYSTTGGHPVIRNLDLKFGKPIEHAFGDLLILEYHSVRDD
ncbi:dolichyl-phosphate-mannose-protein mannosyltransferase [Leptolinea tardivitalis]|nr:dolichyl-phosphate-mannose-protein mannosyltransferase [Leptolinea tardivitalis]